MKNNKRIKRILGLCYVQFFLCILFWIGAGANIFSRVSLFVYVLMTGLLLCNLLLIFFVFMFERLYLDTIRESFQNLEQLNMKLRSQRHEYLNEMQVVYGLLELDEFEEAREYLKPVYTDIAKVGKALKTSKPAVNALLQTKMEYAEKRKVQLYIEVSSDLEGITMEQWDLCKILANLIDNAIAAVSNNASDKEVHVHIMEDEQNYILSVYNNGPVIPENKQQLIFKKGYTSKKEEGHGLGLGIILDIVETEKGIISVDSKEGKTDFEIRLPKKIIENTKCGTVI